MPVAAPEPGDGVVFWTRAVAVGEVSVFITEPESPSVCRFRRLLGRCWDMVGWYDVGNDGNDWNGRNQEKSVPQSPRSGRE